MGEWDVCVCVRVTRTYIVKGRGIGGGVILEEVAGDGCVFDDIRRYIRSCSMRIDHHDDEEQRYCLRYDEEEEMQGMMMMMMMIIRSHSD